MAVITVIETVLGSTLTIVAQVVGTIPPVCQEINIPHAVAEIDGTGDAVIRNHRSPRLDRPKSVAASINIGRARRRVGQMMSE